MAQGYAAYVALSAHRDESDPELAKERAALMAKLQRLESLTTGMDRQAIASAIANSGKMSAAQVADAKTYYNNIYGHNMGFRAATFEFQRDEQSNEPQIKQDLNSGQLSPTQIQTHEQLLAESQQRLKELFGAYRRLPEEVDAFRVGDRTAKRSLTMRFADSTVELLARAKQWLATYVGLSKQLGVDAAAAADLAKAHGFLSDAIVRIQQHLGTLGTTAFERYEAGVLLWKLAELRAVQQNYQGQLAFSGVVP